MTHNLLVLLQKVGTVMTLLALTLTPPTMKKVLEGYSAMKERFANVPGGTFLQYGAIYIWIAIKWMNLLQVVVGVMLISELQCIFSLDFNKHYLGRFTKWKRSGSDNSIHSSNNVFEQWQVEN